MEGLVKINGKEVVVKEYQGKRVVTFNDVDLVHQRVEGTARKRFNDNKNRFILKEDYYELNQPDEIRTLGITRPQGGTPNKVILVTESGYLMLVKSLTDDLAWEVQRMLVKNYFRAQTEVNPSEKEKNQMARAKAMEMNAKSRAAKILLKVADDPLVTKEYKQVIYSYVTETITGSNLIPLPKAERRTYSATEIGEMFGISSVMVGRLANVNKLKTEEYAQLFYDKAKHSNKQVESWRYYDTVIPKFKEILNVDFENEEREVSVND